MQRLLDCAAHSSTFSSENHPLHLGVLDAALYVRLIG